MITLALTAVLAAVLVPLIQRDLERVAEACEVARSGPEGLQAGSYAAVIPVERNGSIQ